MVRGGIFFQCTRAILTNGEAGCKERGRRKTADFERAWLLVRLSEPTSEMPAEMKMVQRSGAGERPGLAGRTAPTAQRSPADPEGPARGGR